MKLFRDVESIFLILISLFGIACALQVPGMRGMAFQPVGPADYSILVLILLLVGVIWVCIKKFKARAAMTEGEKNKAEKKNFIPPEVIKYILITIFLLLFYVLFFDILGYFTTGFLLVVVYMHILFYAQNQKMNFKSSVQIITISIASVMFLYVIFEVLFDLYLPAGIFV